MPKKKTHEQFIKEFNEKNPNANNIEILGKYESGKKPILCRCKIHNYTWSPKAEQLLANKKCCPIGANNLITTTEEFIKELEKINPNIEVLGKYINSKTPIACRCKIDGYEWSPRPDNLRQRKGCHKCANIVKRTHEEFIKEMHSINPNIKILSNFIDTHTYVKCECLIDGNIWEAEPRHLLDKHGCPQCSDSIGEREIAKYLNNNDIEYNPQYKFEDCKFYKQLPFDFYLPQYNICIEFDGKQHNEIVEWFGGLEGFIERKIRDTIKNVYCQQNNIKLIRIPYSEINNIEEILIRELNL